MKWNTREPCGSCPYRKDAPLRLWHPSEFDNLLEQDADPIQGRAFGCHATIKNDSTSVCAGWLLDQKRRGLPSIRLRMALMQSEDAQRCLEKVSDGGYELYGSIEEMVAANEAFGRCPLCRCYLDASGLCGCVSAEVRSG